MDISKIAQNLELGDDGIWYSPEASSISYPESGNEWCFQIENVSYWFRHRNECIKTVIRNFSPPGMVFDIGGGNGYVAAAIQDMGIDVVVIEPGESGAQNARARGLENVVCATFEEAGFKKESLPAASLFDVIEHIEQDVEFLIGVHNRLIHGGMLYISTPAYDLLRSVEDDYAEHYRRYTISGLDKRLEQAGYSVEFSSYIFSFLPVPIALFRTLPSRLGFKRDYHLEQDTGRHRLPDGVTGKLLSRIMDYEIERLARGKRIPFGGSCLIAARKVQ